MPPSAALIDRPATSAATWAAICGAVEAETPSHTTRTAASAVGLDVEGILVAAMARPRSVTAATQPRSTSTWWRRTSRGPAMAAPQASQNSSSASALLPHAGQVSSVGAAHHHDLGRCGWRGRRGRSARPSVAGVAGHRPVGLLEAEPEPAVRARMPEDQRRRIGRGSVAVQCVERRLEDRRP